MTPKNRSRTEVATELSVSQSTGRVTERCRSGRSLATSHADDRYITNNALRKRMMNDTQLRARLKEGGLRAGRPTRVPDHTTGHRRHCLAWAREHFCYQWTSVLLYDESRLTVAEMTATKDVGDVKQSATHRPLVSPDELLVAAVLTVWAGVSSQYRTALHFVTNPYYSTQLNCIYRALSNSHRCIQSAVHGAN
uniref:Transposase Tc1-like domain-containing protein n=1 Tax=Hippocampus comes TaxID=109280 RepID=A0A3Q2XRF7_HIPCM